MLEQYIITYGIGFYFACLILSGGLALIIKSFEKSTWLFVISNIIGFVSGIFYFVFFAGQKIVLFNFDSFLEFHPQITFLSAIFFTITSGIAALVGIYSVRYLKLYRETYNPKILQCLMSFFVLGMQGVLVSNNSFGFLFFWEVMSIVSFFLVFSDKTDASVKAAFLYFIMTHLGASAILGGFLILGEGSIFFDLNNIRSASQNLSPNLLGLAFMLFIFGFGSKAGLVPFHVWLPEAHPQAPSNISALMSGLMLKIAVYGFILVTLSIHTFPVWAGMTVLFLGLLSGLVGALNAVTKKDIKTAFAYSSIENMGIIFTMLGLGIYLLEMDPNSLIAYSLIAFAIMHAISHAFFKTALFLSSGVIINRTHEKSLNRMGGIAKLMPVFAGAFLLVILGSLPIPPFGTFYGEWGLIQNIIILMHKNISTPDTVALLLLVLALVGLIGGLAVFAMIKIFGLSMLGLPHNQAIEKRPEKTDSLLIIPIFILGGSVLLLGFFATPILSELTIQLQNFTTINPGDYLQKNDNYSFWISLAIALVAVFIYVVDKIFFGHKKERRYKTWDCGQSIDVTMQYSATAFMAPIRFFFLTFVGREKKIEASPVVASNPWIKKYSFKLYIKSVWSDALYEPVAKGLFIMAEKMRFVQNGRIQYYVLFLLLALIFTLIFAL